ncbi:hypothetical protein AVEN_136566-1 [Araneus ventricosus]|uniref:Uncharacterized protein n=1 Tax=Araneus ventricosus TaxID=182803 RepID=A0A4Y2GTE6_ARAVE|nr:hypothetical protein AVEN_136566-1 [Araneus ventricosus]
MTSVTKNKDVKSNTLRSKKESWYKKKHIATHHDDEPNSSTTFAGNMFREIWAELVPFAERTSVETSVKSVKKEKDVSVYYLSRHLIPLSEEQVVP